MALAEIETVPRKNRGDLYREALISGLVLHQLDERIPAVLTALFTQSLTVDQVVTQIAQITGWSPSLVAIKDVLAVLGNLNIASLASSNNTEDEMLLKESLKNIKGLL